MTRHRHFSLCLRWAVAATVLLCAQSRAQDPGADLTNAIVEAAATAVSNAIAQLGEMALTNEVSASNDLSQTDQSADSTNTLGDTNLPAGPGRTLVGPSESRRQWLLRQRAGTAGSNDFTSPGRASGSNAVAVADFQVVKPDYLTFKLILDRNIFDPNRVRHGPGAQPKPKTVDSLALVGVMSYDKGTFAFFDGSSSEYKKVLKLADTIAGYKITGIEPNAVKLVAGTNQLELRVGMQLRHEENGGWSLAAQTETYAANSPSTASSSGSNDSNNDVLERLRKKHEQE